MQSSIHSSEAGAIDSVGRQVRYQEVKDQIRLLHRPLGSNGSIVPALRALATYQQYVERTIRALAWDIRGPVAEGRGPQNPTEYPPSSEPSQQRAALPPLPLPISRQAPAPGPDIEMTDIPPPAPQAPATGPLPPEEGSDNTAEESGESEDNLSGSESELSVRAASYLSRVKRFNYWNIQFSNQLDRTIASKEITRYRLRSQRKISSKLKNELEYLQPRFAPATDTTRDEFNSQQGGHHSNAGDSESAADTPAEEPGSPQREIDSNAEESGSTDNNNPSSSEGEVDEKAARYLKRLRYLLYWRKRLLNQLAHTRARRETIEREIGRECEVSYGLLGKIERLQQLQLASATAASMEEYKLPHNPLTAAPDRPELLEFDRVDGTPGPPPSSPLSSPPEFRFPPGYAVPNSSAVTELG